MKVSRIVSAVLALLALAAVVWSAGLVAAAASHRQVDYEPTYEWLALGIGAIVVVCVLVIIALTIALVTIAPSSLTSSPRAPRLLNAIVVTLGILTAAMLAFALFLLWGAGFKTALSLLYVVWLAAGALVSAAMMVIAVGFRALLDKYRVADAELAVVI